MVVFDTTFLLLLLRPGSGHPIDAAGNPIPDVQQRIEYLVQRLEKTKIRIVVPTPVLSEILVHAGAAGPEIVEKLGRSAVFKITPFDTLAAVEAALMTRAAISAGDKRSGLVATWAKVKFDRQIVAIGKVEKVSMIYSDDEDVRKLAAAEGIPITGISELPVPPTKPQTELQLEPITEQGDAETSPDNDPIDGSSETQPSA